MTTAILPSLAAVIPAHMWGPGYAPGWFIVFPFLWILVIGLFIFLGRRAFWRRHQHSESMGAESVLRERYARGEIDETEYRQRLEVLRSGMK